jgi:hypothetical protein
MAQFDFGIGSDQRKVSLKFELLLFILFSKLDGVKECSPFGQWKNKKKEPIYYVHNRKCKPMISPYIFVREIVSYHEIASHTSRDLFVQKLLRHKECKTIDLDKEDMIQILVGKKESVKLVEALAQVSCKFFIFSSILSFCLVNTKCEVKNSCLELLPIVVQSTEVIEAGFRTLPHVLRHFHDEKIASLPKGQLQINRQQYKEELRRQLMELED